MWTLVSASTGTETARYEYGPFGEPLRLTGPAAGSNQFRFSTKRTEDGTGLVLYEYRAYSPALGRWLSRNPIEERGGLHLYAFVRGDPIGRIDPLGLEWNVLKCMQWCNEAVKVCQPIGRKKAAEWCYECCLDVGPQAEDKTDRQAYKACIVATASACLAARCFKPPKMSLTP
ncbi:RHS repeat domain-containing protein [Limisphaera ngatamarikiensis]|uniref:RHS repeat domain-containing protein n=1 Tax=Limisphaera ngatamarikiensis TaxID=1324935 RepID=UPI003CCE4A41